MSFLCTTPTRRARIDHCDLPDLQVCRTLLVLLKQGVLLEGKGEAPSVLKTGELIGKVVEPSAEDEDSDDEDLTQSSDPDS